MTQPCTGPVTYIVSRWGEPTQTFVRREADAVEAAGFDVEAVSIKRPRPANDARPTHWLSPAQVIGGFARAIVRSPMRSATIFASLLTRSSPKNLIRHLPAAAVGMAWFGTRAIREGPVHAHFGWTNATAVWAWSVLAKREFDIVLHAFELHTTSHLDRFTPIPLGAAVQVFTISAQDRDLVQDRWGLDAKVLRMGLPDVVVAAPPRSLDLRATGAIVSVGSLVPKKGHDVLIRALAELDPPWHLSIIGAGPQERELVASAQHLGLTDRVRFTGSLNEYQVIELLDSAWCAVLASVDTAGGDRDGIPVALMEAMGRGTPVVSTDAGAIGELVEGAGILVPQRDSAALAAAIDSLADRDRWHELAASGHARIRSEFSASQAIASLLPTLGAMSDQQLQPSGLHAR